MGMGLHTPYVLMTFFFFVFFVFFVFLKVFDSILCFDRFYFNDVSYWP